MPIPNARANKILDAQHAVTALAALTSPIRSRFLTANGTATTPGTELVTSGGYTSGVGAPITTWAAASGAGTSATSAAVSVTNMPVSTIVGLDEFDSNATPERAEYGPLTTAKTTAAGDTLSFAIGAITSALA